MIGWVLFGLGALVCLTNLYLNCLRYHRYEPMRQANCSRRHSALQCPSPLHRGFFHSSKDRS